MPKSGYVCCSFDENVSRETFLVQENKTRIFQDAVKARNHPAAQEGSDPIKLALLDACRATGDDC
jgi:hypothetical protein